MRLFCMMQYFSHYKALFLGIRERVDKEEVLVKGEQKIKRNWQEIIRCGILIFISSASVRKEKKIRADVY